MTRYAVIETKGDSTRTLALCETKESALDAKDCYRKARRGEDVQIDAVCGKFDEAGKLLENRYTLLYRV